MPPSPSQSLHRGPGDRRLGQPGPDLGPALVAGDFSALWAYVLGPIVGGVLAALLYHRFLAKGDKPA
ncbi:aquaporin [Pseudonocardia sp. NPDC049154]|uniref:aquaporin n=1 Tax=Pseudonocardia sp. NPDC049154 TaxID=3155501 RepID=UPI0033F69D90